MGSPPSPLTPPEPPPPPGGVGRPLAYDASPPVTRRQFRWLMAMTLLNTALLGGYVMGPALWQAAGPAVRQWRAERAAARVTAARVAVERRAYDWQFPPGTLVYDDHGEPLLAAPDFVPGRTYRMDVNAAPGPSPAGVQRAAMTAMPAELSAALGGSTTGVAFARRMTVPGSGEPRLVLVFVSASDFVTNARGEGRRVLKRSRSITALTQVPGNWGTGPSKTYDHLSAPVQVDVPSVASTGPSPPPTFDFARMRRLRVFAGTSDPNDSTRFRIPFEFDGTPGTINGRPDEDGQVSLRPTLGTTTADPPSSVASTPRPRSRTWRLTPATDAP